MIEILNNCILPLVITIFAGWFAWETTLMVDEKNKRKRGGSSVGRASGLHPEGRGFDSLSLHQSKKKEIMKEKE